MIKYFEFLERVKTLDNPEVIDLRFLNKRELLNLIKEGRIGTTIMYDRIRNLLLSCHLNYNFLQFL